PIDGDVSRSIDDFSTTPANRWGPHQGERRVFHQLIQLPGVDGIPNTFDDRLLLAGGGKSYPDNGGEPTSPSSEIFLPPGSSRQPQ
ncbi:MAG: hypothetical protein O7J95_09835, partial [Planctomycetota bacterium]|nr:hypothetical protein [Planctomycetota bacterium]